MKFKEYVAYSSRAQRYRDAQKTFRFRVYVLIETYILTSLAIGLFVASLPTGPLSWLAHANTVMSVAAAIVHYGTLCLHQPWIPLARGFEAGTVACLLLLFQWLNYVQWLPPWHVAACVFALRYWQVGEREITRLGYDNLKQSQTGSA